MMLTDYKEKTKIYWGIFLLLIFTNLANDYIGTIFGAVFLVGFVMKKALHKGMSSECSVAAEYKKQIIPLYIMVLVMVLSFFIFYSYLQNLAIGLFTLSAFFIFPFILNSNLDLKRLSRTFKFFILIEGVLFLYQYVEVAIRFGNWNVFSRIQSLGDFFVGTSNNAHQISITFALISLFFLNQYFEKKNKNSLLWFLISFIMFSLPSFTAAFIVYICMVIIILLLKIIKKFSVRIKDSYAKNKGVRGKGLGLASPLIFIVMTLIILFTFQKVIDYGISQIKQTYQNQMSSRKVVGIYNTIHYFSKESNIIPLIGVGIGNYSSRAGLICSGEYLTTEVSWLKPTPSEYTLKYITPLWNRVITRLGASDGTINQPFNQYQTLYGEGGLIGLSLFVYFLISLYRYKNKQCKGSYLHLSVIMFSVGIMLADNWLEYPNFAFMFWLLIACKPEKCGL